MVPLILRGCCAIASHATANDMLKAYVQTSYMWDISHCLQTLYRAYA